MRKQFFTPEGIIDKELTPVEIQDLANAGDLNCLRELFKLKYSEATGLEQKITVLAQFLGMINI